MSVIHIYSIPQVVELALGTSGGSLMNYPVNRSDFKLFRHVDNEITFWIKNFDRKPVAIANSSVTLNIIDPQTQRVLLTKDLQVIDPTKGQVLLFISGDEATMLPQAMLRYSVTYTRSDSVQLMLYTDRDRTGLGVVEVVAGPVPDPIEPMNIVWSDFYTRNGKQYTGAYPGAAAVLNPSGQHSLAISMTGFTGTFTVQGSLQEQPSAADADWFNVTTATYEQATDGLIHVPFEGNLLAVRFIVQVATGSISSIQYRN